MELENARFDVLRSNDHFVLVEIFKGKEAIEEHKGEPHYKNWNKNVESIMSKPRSKRSYRPVFPTNDDWNAVNTPLQIDENGQKIEVAEGSGTSVACHVTIKVHKKDCAAFEKVSIENAISSKLEEDGGCLRFDIFRRILDDDDNADTPAEYLFAEVFRDAKAQKFHATTAHSQNWKTKVESMMAAERTWTQFDQVVFPEDDNMWSDGEACEDACEMAW
jgi:quinol monooxygenase YgiN